jgi:hypothetical protein
MPTDLLRYLAGPTAYAWVWWLLVAALIAAVAGWYAAVAVWTLPPRTLRAHKLLGPIHRRLLAERFTKSIRATTDAHRAGALTTRQALDAYTGTLRSFLRLATGEPSHVMQIPQLAAGPLAAAAPTVAAIDDSRFGGPEPAQVDVDRVGSAVEEVIRTWP